MQTNIVLVTGCMVGASSWAPTADRLRASGARVQVPDVLALLGRAPAWSAWTSHLVGLIATDGEPFLVGHSLASTLVAELATKIPARGLIIVDGYVPPARGLVPPGNATFRAFVKGLADEGGALPLWSQWYGGDPARARRVGIDALAHDADAFERFEKGLPRINASWFDDAIDLAPWDHIPAGYIQTSAYFDADAEEALRRGWPLKRLQGTHLHPTLEPDETALAIEEICEKLV
jgi:Alpha/beta hydrolase family